MSELFTYPPVLVSPVMSKYSHSLCGFSMSFTSTSLPHLLYRSRAGWIFRSGIVITARPVRCEVKAKDLSYERQARAVGRTIKVRTVAMPAHEETWGNYSRLVTECRPQFHHTSIISICSGLLTSGIVSRSEPTTATVKADTTAQ